MDAFIHLFHYCKNDLNNIFGIDSLKSNKTALLGRYPPSRLIGSTEARYRRVNNRKNPNKCLFKWSAFHTGTIKCSSVFRFRPADAVSRTDGQETKHWRLVFDCYRRWDEGARPTRVHYAGKLIWGIFGSTVSAFRMKLEGRCRWIFCIDKKLKGTIFRHF